MLVAGVIALPLLAQEMTCRRVEGGGINGQEVDAGRDTVVVRPGEVIRGKVMVEARNSMPAQAIAPLAATVNWGVPQEQVWTVDSWIPTGINTFEVDVRKVAPTEAGVYYIIIGFSGVYNAEQIMTSTHPAMAGVWDDGNDVGFDWDRRQFEQALSNGGTTEVRMLMPDTRTFARHSQPFTAVRIEVRPVFDIQHQLQRLVAFVRSREVKQMFVAKRTSAVSY